MIQGGICGKMLLWILFVGMVDSLRIGSMRRPNGQIDFFFVKILSVFWIKSAVICWVRWRRFKFGVILEG